MSVPTPAATRVITPTGTPGAYGHPPKVTTWSPGCRTAVASNTCRRSVLWSCGLSAAPVTRPICPLGVTRTPTRAAPSVASRTVDTCALTEVTVPTKPAPFSTVSPVLMPSALPALIVTASS